MKPRVRNWLWALIFLLVFAAGVIWLSGRTRTVAVDNVEPVSAVWALVQT